MKTYTTLLPFLALAGVLTLGTACEEDLDPNEETNDAIQGDWEVDSWVVGGQQLMGNGVERWDMEFAKQGPFDGETEWDIVGGGDATSGEFDYEIENNGTEIEIGALEFDIEVDGDNLELVGNNIDGQQWVIEAKRD